MSQTVGIVTGGQGHVIDHSVNELAFLLPQHVGARLETATATARVAMSELTNQEMRVGVGARPQSAWVSSSGSTRAEGLRQTTHGVH